MRNAARIVASFVAVVLVAVACNAPRAGSPAATAQASGTPNFTGKTLNIVTGGTGAVYIVYGAGLAELLNKKLGTAASAQSTTASVDNMKLIRDGKADVAFGSQIRNYVIHPYQMVKDLRTGVETSNTTAVLAGDLDTFMQAELEREATGGASGNGKRP